MSKAVSNQNIVPATLNTVEVDLGPTSGLQWEVQQITVENNGLLSCSCSVYLNQRFICGTNQGSQDSADGSSVFVRSGDSLRAVWSNASPLSLCIVQLLVIEWPMGQPEPS
jgi:hypothetical protein